MTAIVGAIAWRDGRDFTSFCSAALDDMRALGPQLQSIDRLGQASFGHALMAFLPEGPDERQPLQSPRRTLMIAADARLDNRADLLDTLGLAAGLGDGELILGCWDQWGPDAPCRMLGDFALAVWDARKGELFLVRSPAASRTLFYCAEPGFAAFATLPQPLNRLVPRSLNLAEMARGLGGGAYFGSSESLFTGIHRVDPGTIVRISSSGVAVERTWHPDRIQTIERNRADAAEEMAWELRRAVEACTRRSSGPLATHLSGGRDSSAVTACAASVLTGRSEPLIALTGAPRPGFTQTSGRHLFDESEAAASVARGIPNLSHVVSRSVRQPLCEALDRASALHAAPMGNPANFAYWTRLQSEAARSGSQVLLTGANGNFSISIGGLAALADVVREDGMRGWLRVAPGLPRSANVSWTTILNQSFGHGVPGPMHRLVRNRILGAPGQAGYPLFSARLRDEIGRVGAAPDTRPLCSYRARVQEIYERIDYPDNLGIGLYGIDLRDPTADRRLIEFCLSLPARDIVGGDGQRPIYDLAFSKLIPAEVRRSRLKGVQGADWFEIYDPEELRAGMRRYGENAAVREYLDLGEVERLLDAWPSEGGQDVRTYGLYANHLLTAVALASWLDVHF